MIHPELRDNDAPAIEAKKMMTERLRYAVEHYFAE
jgi:hypothetical protein